MPRLAALWLLAACLACSGSDVTWPVGDAGSRGFDPARLAAFADDLAARKSDAILVARAGELVHEWYAAGSGAGDRRELASTPKGLVGSPVLVAAAEDGIVGLDDEVRRYIPAWQGDPVRSRVTLRQLASHRSGLDNVFYLPSEDLSSLPEWRRTYHRDPASRFALALGETPFVGEPGAAYHYSGNGYYALSYALARALSERGTNIQRFYAERILEPLEIPSGAWQISYGTSYSLDGLELYAIGSGARMTARAAARLGELILGGGTWHDRQVITARHFQAFLDPPWEDAGARELGRDHPECSLGWYLNRDGFFPSLPRDALVNAGGGHRVLLVVPSLDLVFVRLGHTFFETYSTNADASYWPEIETHVFAPLMDALAAPGAAVRREG